MHGIRITKTIRYPILLMSFIIPCAGWCAKGADVQRRMTRDLEAGRPLVAHVVVALCDNKHQGIQPVPAFLGNGQDPAENLYWGASLGVRTYMQRKGGWKILKSDKAPCAGVLERIVMKGEIRRGAATVPVYIVADAWDGREIKGAIAHFIKIAAGHAAEDVEVKVGDDGPKIKLRAGGDAHVVAYVGHDGLMEFSLGPQPQPRENNPPKSAIVLACLSRRYFEAPLRRAEAHPLLMTNGLMAPEAYTLDAALRTWFGGKSAKDTHEAAAAAYHKYQSCGLNAARKLFYHAE